MRIKTIVDSQLVTGATSGLRISPRGSDEMLVEVEVKALTEADPVYFLTVTDLADADLAAFFADPAGELFVEKGSAIEVGDIFKVGGTGDTTDNALQAAKGSAPAADDVFEVSNIVTEAVIYRGADGTATVSIQGRVGENLPWVELHESTATELVALAACPDIRVNVSASASEVSANVAYR